jgi:hypothetical protein
MLIDGNAGAVAKFSGAGGFIRSSQEARTRTVEAAVEVQGRVSDQQARTVAQVTRGELDRTGSIANIMKSGSVVDVYA